MASFDPATAYANDWQSHDWVEVADYEPAPHDATDSVAAGLRVRREDLDHPDFTGLGGNLAYTADATGFVVWAADSGASPRVGGLLRVRETHEGFAIRSLRRSRFGYWAVIAEPERVDR